MLKGEHTDLRALDRDDAARVHRWLDDAELMRWWGFGAPAVSLTSVLFRIELWLEEERAFGHPVAFIIQTVSGDPAGMLILSDVQHVDRSAELSLFLEAGFRGMGLGADSLATICDAAFTQWNLHRLTVRSEEANVGAHAFFERHRFALEGRMREARYIDGKWNDILIFGRLREEEAPE